MVKLPKKEEQRTDAAAARTPFRFLAIAALAAAAALALVCGWLVLQERAVLDREDELDRQVAELEEELAGWRSDCERQQKELEERQKELEKQQTLLNEAQDTIDLLSRYSLVSPDGEVPEYCTLYPDFYAPEWDGETVSGGKVCCLTFDDGPSTNTDRVLEVLDRYGVKATFFVVGRTGEADQERMRRIVAAGHTLAMHSWSHNYGSVYASVESFLEEFSQLYEWIYQVTGVYPTVFRFPGGSINSYNRGVYQEIIAEMTRRGFVYYDWNVSAQDATRTPRPASDIAADCLRGIGRDLVVVLAHDSAARTTTVDALPAIIEGYQGAGYTFSALHPGVKPVTMGYPSIG